jgi:hypothetical protein
MRNIEPNSAKQNNRQTHRSNNNSRMKRKPSIRNSDNSSNISRIKRKTSIKNSDKSNRT